MEDSKEVKKTKKKKKGKKKKKANKEEASPRETLKNFLNQDQPKQGEQWTDDDFLPCIHEKILDYLVEQKFYSFK